MLFLINTSLVLDLFASPHFVNLKIAILVNFANFLLSALLAFYSQYYAYNLILLTLFISACGCKILLLLALFPPKNAYVINLSVCVAISQKPFELESPNFQSQPLTTSPGQYGSARITGSSLGSSRFGLISFSQKPC